MRHSPETLRTGSSDSSLKESGKENMGRVTREANSTIEGAVCVIDGDEGIRHSLYVLMGTLGLPAATFRTAEEFLEKLGTDRPCFLITELSLPGMDGFDLKRTLDDRGILVPVIAMTGEANSAKELETSRLGFLELVEKPFVYWRLVERVREAAGTPI